MKSQYVTRPCPNCGSDEGERSPAVLTSGLRAEDLEFDRVLADLSSFSIAKTFFSYHRCPKCAALLPMLLQRESVS